MEEVIKRLEDKIDGGLDRAAKERQQIIESNKQVSQALADHAADEMETVKKINERIEIIDQRQEAFSIQLLEINTSIASLLKWQEREQSERRERQIKQDARDELFAELAQAEVDAKNAAAEAEERKRKTFIFYARMSLALAGIFSLIMSGETIYTKAQWALKLLGFE